MLQQNVRRQQTVYRPIALPRVLIIYYSLSGQSRALINLFAAGLRSQGVGTVIERIRTTDKIGFPFGSIIRTVKMMIITFFRARMPIVEPGEHCFAAYDLIVLAGPTWSYNPSGPVLSLLDRYGKQLFTGKTVLPMISCRGYYRHHDFILRRRLRRYTDHIEPSLIFTHPIPEPWSSLGVFLKSIGKHPERLPLLGNRYRRYGHTIEQLHSAMAHGQRIGRKLTGQVLSTDHKARN